jgi:predicted nucleotidyltransferase component of viral defense system
MAFTERYRQQVALLLRTIPCIAKEACFALKGGTAINLFIRDLPRLSVDIDLTYLPLLNRQRSLGAIDKAMQRISARVAKGMPGVQITEGKVDDEVNKLFVRERGVQIKIEVTPVLRGCAYDPQVRSVSPAVEAQFGFAAMQVVSFPDLYAGKVVAALDRQHPRDLFDVRDLLANEGIDDALRTAFIVYLLSHNRPMAEVLAARPKELSAEFVRNFQGMTAEPIHLDDLIAARAALVESMIAQMPKAHRTFLLSFERGEPEWQLLGLPRAAKLPAIMWRQQNLAKLPQGKRADLVAQLAAVLEPAASAVEPTTTTTPAKRTQRRRQ